MVRAGPRLTLLITVWACTICITVLFLPLLFVLILKYLSSVMMVAKENSEYILCAYMCISPPNTWLFQIRKLLKLFSWRANVTLVLARSYEVTNNWGCALCGFPSPLHSVYCSNSAWSVCWWLFNKSLLKKKLFARQTIQNTECSYPLGSA